MEHDELNKCTVYQVRAVNYVEKYLKVISIVIFSAQQAQQQSRKRIYIISQLQKGYFRLLVNPQKSRLPKNALFYTFL